MVDGKTEYYLNHGNSDSAGYYLDLYQQFYADDHPYNQARVTRFQAQELYNRGKYKESIDLLNKAFDKLDSARTMAVSDVDNLLYAQASAEERQLLLDAAERQRKRTERQLFIAAATAALLLLGGFALIRFLRRRQRMRFLEFKLNLARNIHDEANPALLYAQNLLKVLRPEDESQKKELSAHIQHTMEVVRSLSHDLKQEEQTTLGDLAAFAEGVLQKLSMAMGFSYHIESEMDRARFISHYQFTQLKAILNECITNSVKHANFSAINLSFLQGLNKLTIAYHDNGKGWPENGVAEGIGLANMKERSRQLNGDWSLENNYPEGYRTRLDILLR